MRYLFRFIFTLAAFALFSCSEVSVLEVPEKLQEIQLFPVSSMTTKAAIDGNVALPSDRTLVVSAYYNAVTGTSGDYFKNTTFAKDGASWSALSSSKYWPLSGSLDLFAFSGDGLALGAPTYHLSNCGMGARFTVGSNKVGDDSAGQVDIVFGRAVAQQRVPSGNVMALHHANALLVFFASSSVGRDASTNVGITIKHIYLNNARYEGTLAIDASAAVHEQCTWSFLVNPVASYEVATLGSGDCTLPYDVPLTAGGNPTTVSDGWHMGIGGVGIMIPEQEQVSDDASPLGFTIEYTLHNGFDDLGNPIDNDLVYYYKFLPGSSWNEGKKYVYNITFSLNEILVAPAVQDWVESSQSTGL